MAFAFHILGTSSSGNCSILESGGTRIMLDAGFQGPRLEASLAKPHQSFGDVDLYRD
jgi:Cft2 family RNA processing exonuclease